MGFMGLSSWVESDHAADLMVDVSDSVLAALEEGYKTKANSFNTPGPVNVALILKELEHTGLVTEEFKPLVLKCKKYLEDMGLDPYGDITTDREHRELIQILERILNDI